MPIDQAPTGDFRANLTTLLPRLRIYAMSLTRDPDRADDLVQQTVLHSLAGEESFRPGTNFPGWVFRIERNELISGLRRQRPTVVLDTRSPTLCRTRRGRKRHRHARVQEGPGPDGLSAPALLMTTLDGHSHQTIAPFRASVGR